MLGSVDYNQSDIYDSRDILLSLNNNNSILEWQLTDEEYRTNYEELISSTWAINILYPPEMEGFFVDHNQLWNDFGHYNKRGTIYLSLILIELLELISLNFSYLVEFLVQ